MKNNEINKGIVDEHYEAFIKSKFSIGEEAKPVYERLLSQATLSVQEFYDLLDATCNYKYINRQQKDSICYLDAERLNQAFSKIEKDENVIRLDKLSVIKVIDFYYDLRIKINWFNIQFGIDNGNRIFNLLKKAINYTPPECNPSTLSQKKYEDMIAQDLLFSRLQLAMKMGILKGTEMTGVEIYPHEVNKELLKILTGTTLNVRKVELLAFPLLYQYLELKPEYKLPTKKLLLWDLMTIILPERFDQDRFNKCIVNEDKYDLMKTITGL